MTAIKIALKEIQKKIKDGLYLQISKAKLNQIYDIPADLEKQITLCMVPTHIGVRGNEKAK